MAQFSTALTQLNKMLANSEQLTENDWQIQIQDIMQLLYPQYIFVAREIEFEGIDGNEKRPDFLIIDTNGFIDILEIKTPNVQLLTTKPSYRNNYIPVREFSGAIQQIEKYILCLTSIEKSRKQAINQLSELTPPNIELQFVNPKGIFIAGRSNHFNAQQKRDFEIIKRQYKNIADIMTYDDLINRLNNIIYSLQVKLDITK